MGLRVPIYEAVDIRFELGCGGVDTTLDLLAREFGEPTLDLIYPRCGCRCEMDVITRSVRQPGLDHRRFMRGLIVHDDMDVEGACDIGVDLFEKIEKLGCPMPLVAFADDGSGGDIENGEVVPCRT